MENQYDKTYEVNKVRRDMTEMIPFEITNRPHLQTELFRPSLQYPSHAYAELLSRTAEHYPENEAVTFSSPIPAIKGSETRQIGNEKDVNLTYRELDALVNAFANALLDLGIGKGDRVCLLMTNRPEFIISWFALARIGAIISPIESILQGARSSLSIEQLRSGRNYCSIRTVVAPRKSSGANTDIAACHRRW